MLKIQQEDRLFDILLLIKTIEEGSAQNLDTYLGMMCERAQSGMTAEEIDAVRERVTRAFNAKIKKS